MPAYAYNKDYPFAAYITNLGKYNEGELVGEWVKFPTTAEELKNVFARIGIGSTDEFGSPYEEWFISDYDCYVDGLHDLLGEYADLDELNYLASKLDEMMPYEYEQFQAAVEFGDHTGSIKELINLTENLDCYDVFPGISDHDDLGRYYVEELGAMAIPEYLQHYIDYDAYGRDIALEQNGEFTSYGYVMDSGDSFDDVYDGDRDSIPDEYRILGEAQDLLEESLEEARAAPEPDTANTFSIYQIKPGEETADARFASMDSLQQKGLSVNPAHYDLVYTAPLAPGDDLETIFTIFNTAHPQDYTGRSLSVSDVVVLHENDTDRAYFCDSFDFKEVPEFLNPPAVTTPTPDEKVTGETIRTPRGTFRVTDMSHEQIGAIGYGFHHRSDDGKYDIMGNGTRAFAIRAEQPEKKLSIKDRLAEAKKESAEQSQARKAVLQKKPQNLEEP